MVATDMAKYMRERRAKRRLKLLEYRGGQCKVCNTTKNLEFNHRDRADKSFGLSGRGLDKPWSTLLLEADKCDVLCTEHHLAYTRKQYSVGEIRPWNDGRSIPYIHGTARCYHETACRCADCRHAKKLYRAKEIDSWEVVHSPQV